MRTRLASTSASPSLDAQVLLAHVLEVPRAWVLAHPEARIPPAADRSLERALRRLEAGEALPHVLGSWEFYGLQFTVTPAVLIPRPETELLVETARAWLEANPDRRRVADVGTGSGCIAVSLAAHLPDLRVLASDLSWQALRCARRNARAHGVADRIQFVQADLLSPLDHSCDVVCANLPYVPSQELPSLEVYGREPTLALDGGPDGLREVERLLHQAPPLLARGGVLLLEIDSRAGQAALVRARRTFPHAEVSLRPDLAGRDRLLVVALP